MNLQDMELAVLGDDKNTIKDILSELDRKTESEMFLRAAEHFGFKTVEHHGRRLTTRAEVSRILGYSGESSLRMLCEKYDLECLSPGTSGSILRKLVIETFGLHPNDGRTALVGWDVFLVAGMQATTAAARQVKMYLIEAERAGRIAAGALNLVKGKRSRIDEADKVVSMIARADRIKNAALRELTLQHIDDVLDGALHIPVQQGFK